MTSTGALSLRLRNQRLTSEQFATPAEAVAWFGAMQAQDYAAAAWALGVRLHDPRAEAIDTALAEGSIVRTHVLRPTWHFVARDDLRWMLALSGPRVIAQTRPRQQQLGIEDDVVATARQAAAKALSGGQFLTRPEMEEAFRQGGIERGEDGQRLPWLLMRLELEGVICSGPRRGRLGTWALLDERVPPAPELDRDEALLELTRRYFRARGPATARDYAWWSGLTLTDCRRGIALAGDELVVTSAEGEHRYASAAAPPETRTPALHLLPAFDEYTVGYRDRSMLVSDPAFARTDLLTYVIVDASGRVAGTWKRTIANGRVRFAPAFFAPPSQEEMAAFEAAAAHYAASLGGEPEVAWP